MMKITYLRLKRGLIQFNAEDTFRAGLDTQIEEVPHGFKITSKDKVGVIRSVGVPAIDASTWEYVIEKKEASKPAVKAPA